MSRDFLRYCFGLAITFTLFGSLRMTTGYGEPISYESISVADFRKIFWEFNAN